MPEENRYKNQPSGEEGGCKSPWRFNNLQYSQKISVYELDTEQGKTSQSMIYFMIAAY
jgi:hypothetical protein